ncbi:hypothetical protein [Virgibacillus ndiopensis]|uniref:hypothetical protein n=1 Tax=Virgibacillus ndiopensis TaxID=2004408 RepID=UPI0031844397
MNKYSKILLRFSALFALVGAFLGSHMAGAGGYAFKTVHAHILVVGWLTLFVGQSTIKFSHLLKQWLQRFMYLLPLLV